MGAEPDSWENARGAEAYAEAVRRGVLYRALAARLGSALAPRDGTRALDLAAGTGLVTEFLLARAGPGLEVVCADRSQAMLDVARREIPLSTAAFVRADPARLPFGDAAFAVVACSASFWHFPSPRGAFAEIARVLAPAGRFGFNVPAAQLEDAADLPPAPLQLALAREGAARFGAPPAPGGPVRRKADLLADAHAAGLALVAEHWHDIPVPQGELLALLEVPAIGARPYPDVSARERAEWTAAAAARVDPAEVAPIRWWECLLWRPLPASSAP